MDHSRQLSQVPQGTESMAPPRSSPRPTPTAQRWRGECSRPPAPSTHPPSWTRAALRTGVPVGAGQTVSGHLRRGLVTSVQELLGAEHVAGVSDPVHAVQDAGLGRGRAHGHTRFSPPLLHPPRAQLSPPGPQLPRRGQEAPGLQFPSPRTSRFSPPHPGSSPAGLAVEGRGPWVPPRRIHCWSNAHSFLSRKAGTSWHRGQPRVAAGNEPASGSLHTQ